MSQIERESEQRADNVIIELGDVDLVHQAATEPFAISVPPTSSGSQQGARARISRAWNSALTTLHNGFTRIFIRICSLLIRLCHCCILVYIRRQQTQQLERAVMHILFSMTYLDELAHNFKGEISGDLKCVICTDDMTLNSKLVTLDCSHSFHFDCLTNWFGYQKSTCPICRRDYGTEIAKYAQGATQ